MSENRRVSTRATGVVGIAILCSRILGLLREVVFASLFGASKNMDAFLTAFRAPNMLRDLFAEGALSTAFVTTFSQRIAKEGDQSAWRLASKVATLTIVFMSTITVLGIIFAPGVIHVLAPGFAPDKAELTILLTRIMFPFILLVSLAALLMGMLNAKDVFGVPAMASSFFNLGSIIGGAGFGYLLDPHFGSRALIGLALGTLVGGLAQLLVQVPSLVRIGFRFRPDFKWRDPGVRNILVADGAGDDRSQRSPGECGGEQRFRLLVRRRAHDVAQHRVSSNAIAARSVWRGDRNRDVAADFAKCRAR